MIAIKYKYETIEYNNNLPARIELVRFTDGGSQSEPHWHKEIELICVLDGGLAVTKNGARTVLAPGDVYLINSSEIHSVTPDGCKSAGALSVHLSYDFAKKFDETLDLIYFQAGTGTEAEAELKALMKQLAGLNRDGAREYSSLKQYALMMDIFHVLFSSCRRQKQISLYGSCKVSFRNAKVAMEYIEEHFRDELSLNIMSGIVGLNPIYFSKYFKDATGMGFNAYLGSVRMKHALDDMLNHGMSATDAAKCNGFPNVKSFETVCKRCYGLTPLQFKKQQLKVS